MPRSDVEVFFSSTTPAFARPDGAVISGGASAVTASNPTSNPADVDLTGADIFGTAGTVSTGIQFPRLCAVQYGALDRNNDADKIAAIAKYDLAYIQYAVGQTGSGTSVPQMRADGCKVLQYVAFQEMYERGGAYNTYQDKLDGELGPNGVGDWNLRDVAGNKIQDFGGADLVNISDLTTADGDGKRWPEWLVGQYDTDFNNHVAYDGVFIDVFGIQPRQSGDWQEDGVEEHPTDPNAIIWYTEGHIDFLARWRAAHPSSEFLIGCNSGWMDASAIPLNVPSGYQGSMQYGLMEAVAGLGSSFETWSGWETILNEYARINPMFTEGVALHFIGSLTDWQMVRYGLCTALMQNGFFAYSQDLSYAVNPIWADEFDLAGTATSKYLGEQVDDPQTTFWLQGVWRRRFAGGVAFVNPKDNGPQTVAVGPGLKSFFGPQDSTTNNGLSKSSITLQERDGIILVPE